MTLDRKIAPQLNPIAKPDFLCPDKFLLDNQIPVYLLHAGTQEVCKLDIVFKSGIWYQQKPLLAAISNAMLQEGTKNYTASQIAEIFDFHGAYIQLNADYHFGTISIISLEKHLNKLLPIVEELIKDSIFPRSEFENLLKRRKQRFLLEMEKVKILSQKKFSETLFGDNHPYNLNLKAEDFDEAELDDFITFYRQFYHAGNCEIHLSGRFSNDLTRQLNRHFGSTDWGGSPIENLQKKIKSSTEKLIRITKPDSIQSAIRLGRLLVPKNHSDYFGLQILTTVLGGYFSSRLMLNIREDKGYTYGIGAHFVSLNEAGYFIIATEVDKTYEEATLCEIHKELEILRNELVSTPELERVKQYLTSELLREFDGPFALSQAFRNLHDFNLDNSFYDAYYWAIQSISAAELKRLAQVYFQSEDLFTVIAGQ
ncbi:M16 family metallopeptidase [Mangrovibacterium sp.]|uniref:M16 family metallopeptidase n=1 Tax=Mangrovibacterium sp. TaxID=1961364 RepID=UPI00356321A1